MNRDDQLTIANQITIRVQSLLAHLGALPSVTIVQCKISDANMLLSVAAVIKSEDARRGLLGESTQEQT